MIFEWLLGHIVGLLEGWGAELARLIPAPPAWVTGAGSMLAEARSYMSYMGGWVPWEVVGGVVAFVMVVLVAAFAIQVIRIVLSFLTLGGGGT